MVDHLGEAVAGELAGDRDGRGRDAVLLGQPRDELAGDLHLLSRHLRRVCVCVLCGRPPLLLCVRCPMCRVHAVNATRLEYRIRQVWGVATGPRVAVLAMEA